MPPSSLSPINLLDTLYPPARQGHSIKDIGRMLLSASMVVGLILCSDAFAATQHQGSGTSALKINSASALIVDERGNRIYGKNTREVKPIASVTKLMTAMVVLDSGVALDAPITITEADRDTLRHSRSRLRIGQATLSRREMLMVALMSSDNRAAAALARTSPGGTPQFVAAMNRKARDLGMQDTAFVDSSGLDNRNRSTAEDLVKMVRASARYPLIREATSRGEMTVHPFAGAGAGALEYRNTNPLVRNPEWHVEVSKTGFINEAGHCLVMQTRIGGRRLYVVFLDAVGKLTPVGDSNRLRTWLAGGQRIAGN
ncbi:D-alanyl-D-alanine endopeptidase [Thiocapsa marina]|uniref:Peptidase S11 D-alanyl-D-alanine carboxypeptidase 1 n=1 Tax=Thiocapsa marina 5811 TaxID=768671 RepID=F9UA72_9GAMM|nr:D-alanyl-D-alanine endopeptidase [Thiocapsa marina]EGV19020.1 peptidase S11 D-alanyl-D-alanine carboxypeptidase 1 [Thiocapsa marina 5811]